jgi:antibiotic biosynthesis monooxygenase (ABM) superfamily enzyme
MPSTNQTREPVTAIFSWTVKSGKESDFQAAMHHVHQAAKTFPGHLGITTFRSPTSKSTYFTVLRFDSPDHMHSWMKSAARHDLIQEVFKTASLDTDFEAPGLETWFELPGQTQPAPPKWKMVTAIFIAIYPLSLLFNIFVAPHLVSWPVILRSLVFSVIAPTLLTYFLMPFVSQKLLKRWLYPKHNL